MSVKTKNKLAISSFGIHMATFTCDVGDFIMVTLLRSRSPKYCVSNIRQNRCRLI